VCVTARRCAGAVTSYGPVSVSVCVGLSVTSRCSVKMDVRINLVFGVGASFDQSYTAFSVNSGMYRNKGTFLSDFFLNAGLRKFRHGISSVERAINLARER